MEEIITVGGLVTFIIEVIKWAWRKWIAKDPAYDFPTAFYTLSIPLLNALVPFVVFWLGFPVDNPLAGMSLIEVAKYLGTILLGSLITLVSYNAGLKPLKRYDETRG